MPLRRTSKALLASAALAALALLSSSPASAQYIASATSLTAPGYDNSIAHTNISGTQYGNGVNTTTSQENALQWNATYSGGTWSGNTTATNLQPTNGGSSPTYSASLMYAQAGGMEGGIAYSNADGFNHAVLWNGVNTTVTDLQPAIINGLPVLNSGIRGMSTDGTSTGIQVGFFNDNTTNSISHATAWFGTAASAIDLSTVGGLTCSNNCSSTANGVNSSDQVVGTGQGAISSYLDNALLWSVNASNHTVTITDLNPAAGAGVNFNDSAANAISGSTVVGDGVNTAVSANNHALMWNIANLSNITYTDLNNVLPAGTYTSGSAAYGVRGAYIVGDAFTTPTTSHAILWINNGASYVDLQSALPLSPAGTAYTGSVAYGFGPDNTIVGEATYLSGTTLLENAVIWQVGVPAPPALPVLASGLTLIGGALARRRRRKP